MKRLILLSAALLASPLAAQSTQSWSTTTPVEVRLSSFKFTPKVLHLRAGQPVVLHLVNTGKGGHNFSAPSFFAAAELRPQDAVLVSKGEVEVSGHASKDIALVPRAGRYDLKCTHTLHPAFGMTGRIVVD
jgi:plastocyanin